MAFPAAGVASLLPLIGRWAPPPIGPNGGLATFILVATLAVGFGAGLAIVLGASMIGRDLAERRLSFYLARPITPAELWFGKLIGSFLIAFLSAVIVLIPTAVLVPDAWPGNLTLSAGESAACLALGVLILLLVSHVVSTMLRSRSAWLLMDLAAAILFVLSCGLVIRSAWRAHATVTVLVEIWAIVASSMLVALAAGELQLSHGRTDVRRNHRALSVSLWSGLAIVGMLAIAWGSWLRSADLREFRYAGVATPSNGPWIAVWGQGRWRLDYPSVMLLNTENGSTLNVQDLPYWQADFRFARNGRRVVWVQASDDRIQQISVGDLGTTARIHRFTGPSRSRLQALGVSADGGRVATLADGILAVFESREGRSIAAFHTEETLTDGGPTPQTFGAILSFADDDHLRLYRFPLEGRQSRQSAGATRSLTIDEYDLRHRHKTRTGAFSAPASHMFVVVTPDGRLLVTVGNDEDRGNQESQRRFVLDPRSGAVVREISGAGRF